MVDLARGEQLVDHGLDGVRRDGEADADVPVARATGLDLRVDPDHGAERVEQGPAAVAVVDRGVGLDHVVDRVAVRRLDGALEGTDDAGRDGALEAERVADRDDRVAHLDLRRVGEREGRQRIGLASTLSSATSVEGSLPTSVAFSVSSFEKRTSIEVAPSMTW